MPRVSYGEGREGVAEVGPTVRQRELGIRLRELRKSSDLTVEDVAERLLCSATKISRAETGARRPTLRDVRDLCALYEVSSDETAELMELAREARKPGWWARYDNNAKVGVAFIEMEQAASSITSFEMYFLPALLQTEDYAKALIRGVFPKISSDILGQRVEARMRRQQLLSRPKPPRYRALLDEAVLHRQIGGASVMKAQLAHVIQLIEDEKVTVQVIPFSVGSYTAHDCNFDYLEFAADLHLKDLVYVEQLTRQIYLDGDAEVEAYRDAVESLRDIALSPRESAKKIHETCNS